MDPATVEAYLACGRLEGGVARNSPPDLPGEALGAVVPQLSGKNVEFPRGVPWKGKG